MHIINIMHIIAIISDCFLVGWWESVRSLVVYGLDFKKPILYVIPISSTSFPFCNFFAALAVPAFQRMSVQG